MDDFLRSAIHSLQHGASTQTSIIVVIISLGLVMLLGATQDTTRERFEREPFKSSVPAEAADYGRELKIDDLVIYPIKSCRGTSIKESTYDERGLKWDRLWMLIDAEKRTFITARQFPRLLLVVPTIDEKAGVLRIAMPDHSTPFEIPLEAPKDAEKVDNVQIWRDTTDGVVASPADSPLTKALSALVKRPVLLVQKGEAKRVSRGMGDVHSKVGVSTDFGQPHTAYADGSPALFATAESLDDLKRRIGKADETKIRGFNTELWSEGAAAFPMDRFRPNVVVSGAKSGEEDGWSDVTLGEARWRVTSRCTRCLLPNVDPETAQRDPAVPSKILREYRNVDRYQGEDQVCFGVNATPIESKGVLRVGDSVRVTKRFGLRSDGSGSWARPEDELEPRKR